MKILVGSTGFVGSNIYQLGEFDKGYNSKNIREAYGTKPELLVYSGLPAEKFLANSNPDKDMELIREAEKNIESIAPKKIILISTIDVFKNIDINTANTLHNIKDLIDNDLVVSRYAFQGISTTGEARTNGYYIIDMFRPIFAGIQNNNGASRRYNNEKNII